MRSGMCPRSLASQKTYRACLSLPAQRRRSPSLTISTHLGNRNGTTPAAYFTPRGFTLTSQTSDERPSNPRRKRTFDRFYQYLHRWLLSPVFFCAMTILLPSGSEGCRMQHGFIRVTQNGTHCSGTGRRQTACREAADFFSFALQTVTSRGIASGTILASPMRRRRHVTRR